MSYCYFQLAIVLAITTGVNSLSCPLIEQANCTGQSIVKAICNPRGIVKDMCAQCWKCAHSFGEPCGGISNHGGTCDIGLKCSNTDGNKNQLPGVYCRTSPASSILALKPGLETLLPIDPSLVFMPDQECSQTVINPCSLQRELFKGHGEACEGPGKINGTCAPGLRCFGGLQSTITGRLVAPLLEKPSVGTQTPTCFSLSAVIAT